MLSSSMLVAILVVCCISGQSIKIELPKAYDWLDVKITLMNNGGEIPQPSLEQWQELKAMMTPEHFNRLAKLLKVENITQVIILSASNTKFWSRFRNSCCYAIYKYIWRSCIVKL